MSPNFEFKFKKHFGFKRDSSRTNGPNNQILSSIFYLDTFKSTSLSLSLSSLCNTLSPSPLSEKTLIPKPHIGALPKTPWHLSRRQSLAKSSWTHPPTESPTSASPTSAITCSSPPGTRYALTSHFLLLYYQQNKLSFSDFALRSSLNFFFFFLGCDSVRACVSTMRALMCCEVSSCMVVQCSIVASMMILRGSVPVQIIQSGG